MKYPGLSSMPVDSLILMARQKNNEEFTLNKDQEIEEIVDEEKWYDVVIDTMQKYYIKFIVATISTMVSISIFSVIYRKVKHKL